MGPDRALRRVGSRRGYDAAAVHAPRCLVSIDDQRRGTFQSAPTGQPSGSTSRHLSECTHGLGFKIIHEATGPLPHRSRTMITKMGVHSGRSVSSTHANGQDKSHGGMWKGCCACDWNCGLSTSATRPVWMCGHADPATPS